VLINTEISQFILADHQHWWDRAYIPDNFGKQVWNHILCSATQRTNWWWAHC